MSDLRSLLEQLGDRGEQRGAAEVLRRAKTELGQVRPDMQRQRRGALLPAAVAMLIVAAGVVTLLRAGDQGDRVEVTGPTRADMAAGWARHDKASAGIGDASVHGIAGSSSVFIVVGQSFDPAEGSSSVGVWTSAAGRRWSALAEQHLPRNATRLEAVTAHVDGSLWMVGRDRSGRSVWRSNDDGRSWSQSPTDRGALENAAYFLGLTSSASRLIAFGTTDDGQGGTWSSSDGTTWRFAPLPGPVVAVAGIGGRMVALVQTALVEMPGGVSRTDVVFTSADGGATWTESVRLGITVDPAGESLACNDAGCWAATGPTGSTGPSILWHSVDGARWDRVDTTLGAGAVVDTITAVDGYLVITGFDDSRPGGWVSRDGADWTPMPDLGRTRGGRLHVVTSRGRTLVAFGSAAKMGDFFTWEAP